MPLVPAAKGVILLTPIILATGYAIYDAHPPFRSFVDEQWRRLQDFAEEQGWRERGPEPMSFSNSSLWDPADGIGLRERESSHIARHEARRRSSAAMKSKQDEIGLSQTTGIEPGATTGLGKRRLCEDERDSPAASGIPLSEESLRNLNSTATGTIIPRPSKSEEDTMSGWSKYAPEAILTPTTEEEGSLFGDSNDTQHEFDSATAQSDAGSDTTETATDADMISSTGIDTPDHEPHLPRDEDAASVASSWSEIGSEVSFESTL